ncbi:PREDICTED: uncharacterized protein LOC109159933 [Ipomoea nil]|uniref:uncharacterized protein LOC109159933 n=1 Tax=Ipomoea nil TaxID=35883 RepID=UPI000901FF1E|nr:PREDICTED: uncharacterized protein LOC109159933 [Ipomoea nil]
MVHCCNFPQDNTKLVWSTGLRLLLESHSIINMGLSTEAKVVCVVFMTTLLLAMLQHSLADMKMEWGGKTKFRKVLYTLKDEKQKSIFNGNGNGNGDENGNMKKKKSAVEWELRAAPLGPDPLHHNGGSPRKKPTTMP